ncbi:MAG TPA: hypothetical protein VFG23_15535 [Polyangia bacterium]|nr:hypothetical protein [Polyangia bacterium]
MKTPQRLTARDFLDATGTPLRRPVVYLDWSTLSDAFPTADGATGHDGAALTELTELVAEIARSGTLCFSIAHLIELIAMRPREAALARAQWLDRLEHAWVNISNAEKSELIDAVRRQLGLTSAAARAPVHHPMSASIINSLTKQTAAGIADILSDPTTAGFVGKAHGRVEWEAPKEWSADQFKRLHADRLNLPPGTTREEVHQKTFSNFTRGLKVTARAAIHSEPVIVGEPLLTDEQIDAAVDRLLDDRSSLPMNRIVQQAWRGAGDRITNQSIASKKFSSRYGSLLWDLRHLVAGGFADIFTCDHFVEKILADFRTQRGLPKQLSIGGCGDLTGFVAALRRQVEAG